MQFLQDFCIKQGVIVPELGTQGAFSGCRAYARVMRYRGNVCITIDPDVLRLFDAAIAGETHAQRTRSRVIEGMMSDRIAAWQEREKARAITMEAMHRFESDDCAGDLIIPPETRDVPGSLASGILNETRTGQECDEDLQHGSRRPRVVS